MELENSTRKLSITFGLALLCVNIFFILQIVNQPIKELQELPESFQKGRTLALIRWSINILVTIPLIYGAARYKSLFLKIGFICWCTQSFIGWPIFYYYADNLWKVQILWEVIITIKLEICFLLVTWGCYKHSIKSE